MNRSEPDAFPTATDETATAESRRPRLGIITDEVSDDPHEACALIAEWGVKVVELRTAWGKNLLELSDAQLDELEEAVAQSGLEVVGIASPVFKSPLDEQPQEKAADFALAGVESMSAQLELLERACTLATRFSAPMVRVFTFWREPFTDEVAGQLVEKLARAAELASFHNVLLAVENEPVCVVATGTELGLLLAALAAGLPPSLQPHVGALWDPGNALAAGEDDAYPAGYRALDLERLAHVHLKDLQFIAPGQPTFVPLGRGELDYRGQLSSLLEDGYVGDMVLEPHYRPPGLSRALAAKECVDAARAMLDELGLKVD